MSIKVLREGGVGSGNFGHAGVPGQVGGSAPGGGSQKPATDANKNLAAFASAISALSPEHFNPGADPKLVRQAYHFDKTLNDKITHEVASNGGVTISVQGDVPTHGFVVGGAGTEEIHDVPVGEKDVNNYINRNLGALTLQDHYFGAWVDDGKCYFDVSTIRGDKVTALEEARTRDQIAIWSLDEGKGYSTMSDDKRPSESKGDPIKESQKRSGPTLLLFGHTIMPNEIAVAINAVAAKQTGSNRTITIRRDAKRG
jgi:hypothetical protein